MGKIIMGIIYIMAYSYIYRIYVNMENIINIAGKFTGMIFHGTTLWQLEFKQ